MANEDAPRTTGHVGVAATETRTAMLTAARAIVRGPSLNRTKTAGYDIKPGEQVLLVAKTTDDPLVTEVLVQAIEEVGAQVDVFMPGIKDRELDELDEFRGLMYNVPGIEVDNDFQRWRHRISWLEDVAKEQGYQLLIQGEAGPLPNLPKVRYEGAPWFHRVTFPAAGFPWPLWDLINKEAWRPIWEHGRNAEVHLTDPEGTDIRWVLPESHWHAETYETTGSRRRFNEDYYLGHLFGWVTPPYLEPPQMEGVVGGTINHFGSPFPHCKVGIKDGILQWVEGGGEYGKKWAETHEMTKDIKYPEHPTPGLFYVWECAIGTHPKMSRPPFAWTLSGHAAMFERLRSGIIHIGIGTGNNNPNEIWAAEQGLPYGHLHLHLNFPTYKLYPTDGGEITVIENGRLKALDSPAVREKAAEYGDPDDILRVEWTPPLPGVSVSGDYWKDYAPDPLKWLKEYDRQIADLEEGF